MNIGIIGFGEVGKIFAHAIAQSGEARSVSVWDVRWTNGTRAAEDATALNTPHLYACTSVKELCERSSNLIFSAVTASNAYAVADEMAPWVQQDTVLVDLNSASPETKKRAADQIIKGGGQYVDAGVMTSVPPYGIAVPVLIGGAKAASVVDQLRSFGMNVTVVSDRVGVASAIKMSRSIMIKGLEALVIESYTTARAYGVEDYVLPTLKETFPSIDWEKQGDYFFSRVVQHGKRRSEEMVEAAQTVREGVLEPTMTAAIAQRQGWVAQQRVQGILAVGNKPWRDHADALIQSKRKKQPT